MGIRSRWAGMRPPFITPCPDTARRSAMSIWPPTQVYCFLAILLFAGSVGGTSGQVAHQPAAHRSASENPRVIRPCAGISRPWPSHHRWN